MRANKGHSAIPESTKRAFRRDPSDPRHGTVNGYSNLGCSCDRCREAWRIECRPRQLKHRREVLGILPMEEWERIRPKAQHGTRSKYVHGGCRCDDCRAAAARYQAEYRQRRAS